MPYHSGAPPSFANALRLLITLWVRMHGHRLFPLRKRIVNRKPMATA